jgi:UDP-N-acetylmuramate dehydrogenase
MLEYMKVLENISFKDFTTFRTGGTARWFFCVQSVEEVRSAILFAKEKKLPFFILGGGSNVLVSDDGYFGVVIQMKIMGMRFEEKENGLVSVTAGAGEDWDGFVGETVSRGLVGLENLSLIPGTVGAAPVQNIGAYGREVKDIIFEVEIFDTETFEIKKIPNKACGFGYRDSFFKSEEGKENIILNVSFDLKKNGELKMEYKDVQEYFSKNNISSVGVVDVRKAVIAIRKEKLPDVNKYGTAGSFFKNPILSQERIEEMLRIYPDMPVYSAGINTKKVPAGWLLDRVCGLRGFQRGGVGTYKNQALVIVNHGNATTKDILEFAQSLQDEVKNKTGIILEPEIQLL